LSELVKRLIRQQNDESRRHRRFDRMLEYPADRARIPARKHHELGQHLLPVTPVRAAVVTELRPDGLSDLRVCQLWPLRFHHVRDVKARALVDSAETAK